MDHTLILIRCITLLLRESQMAINYNNSSGLVKEVLETITLPEQRASVSDPEKETLIGLKHIASTMLAGAQDQKYVTADLLQKTRMYESSGGSLYDTLKEGIEGELSQDDLATICLSIRRDLGNYLRDLKAKGIIAKANQMVKYNPEKIEDLNVFILKMINELEPYSTVVKERDPAVVSTVSINDLVGAASMFDEAKELNDDRGILKTGWQGLNRMLEGGFRRGYECVIGALQHNYKTGFTMQLFTQVARYNKPYMVDETRKPLLLRISFEDPLSLNLPFIYRNLWELKYSEPAPFDNVSGAEMAKFIEDELSVQGYECMFMHVNPSLWTYRDVQNKIIELESQGYEIHLLMLDYLAMLPTTGCLEGGPMGSAMRDMYRRMRNFCSS